MNCAERLRVCVNLFAATFFALVEIPIPDLFPGAVHFLVKRVKHLIQYGERNRDQVCSEVQSEGSRTCSVAEADVVNDGEARSENGSSHGCEHKPDETQINDAT